MSRRTEPQSNRLSGRLPQPTVHRLLVAGATLWCAAIVAAPVLGLDSAYTFFALICHQNPDRSWTIAGAQLAVCVRCASIYGGFLLALALRLPARGGALKVALAATFLEVLIAQIGFDFEAARALTGLALGLAAAGFVEAGVQELFSQRLRRLFLEVSR